MREKNSLSKPVCQVGNPLGYGNCDEGSPCAKQIMNIKPRLVVKKFVVKQKVRHLKKTVLLTYLSSLSYPLCFQQQWFLTKTCTSPTVPAKFFSFFLFHETVFLLKKNIKSGFFRLCF